jgi:hypothetical protein
VEARYRGAQPFTDTELDRKLFFGRADEARVLANKILAHRLVVVFARSGLGKTSLLNAGVADLLRQGGCVPLFTRVDTVNAGDLRSIYGRISPECSRQGVEYVAGDKSSLWLFFKTAQFWSGDDLLTPVLILDQFEELFTLQDPESRTSFISDLSYLVRGMQPPQSGGKANPWSDPLSPSGAPPLVRVVISLREDFLAELDELADRIPEILDERFRLRPLNRAAAAAALGDPTRILDDRLDSRPFVIDEKSTNKILDFLEQKWVFDVSKQPGAIEPFQLQLIGRVLEKRAREKQSATITENLVVRLEDIGGQDRLRSVLQDFYEEQLASLSFTDRWRVRNLCVSGLMTPGRRRLRIEETEVTRVYKVKPATLTRLVDGRLLRVDQTEIGKYYELSHDSLIKPIMQSEKIWLILDAFLWVAVILIAITIAIVPLIDMYVIKIFPWRPPAEQFNHVPRGFILIPLIFISLISVLSYQKLQYTWDKINRVRS